MGNLDESGRLPLWDRLAGGAQMHAGPLNDPINDRAPTLSLGFHSFWKSSFQLMVRTVVDNFLAGYTHLSALLIIWNARNSYIHQVVWKYEKFPYDMIKYEVRLVNVFVEHEYYVTQ